MGVGMESEQRHKTGSGRKTVIVLLLVLLLLAAGCSALFFIKYKQAVNKAPANERQQILSKIEPIIALPDEQPELSTVLDTTKLTNQTLRQRANNGDKLLIYSKAKRLVIYRPSSGKVVDMLTIQVAPQTIN
jgi:hypothetical protein